MTLVKLYLTVNFAVPQKLLQDCTTVNSFSVLPQFTVKTCKHNSVCAVRVLERHTVRKLYRSAKIVSTWTKLITGYLKAYWHTSTTNDCAHGEREKTFSRPIKHKNVEVDVHSNRREESKKKTGSVRPRTLVYCQTMCHWIFGKNARVCGTMLCDQIFCVLEENAEWNNHVIKGGIWEGNVRRFGSGIKSLQQNLNHRAVHREQLWQWPTSILSPLLSKKTSIWLSELLLRPCTSHMTPRAKIISL